MFNSIVNPKTRRKVSIYSNIGKKILQNYINQLGGAAASLPIKYYSESNFKSWFKKTFFDEYGENINRHIKTAKIYIKILRERAFVEYQNNLIGPDFWHEDMFNLYLDTLNMPYLDALSLLIDTLAEKYYG